MKNFLVQWTHKVIYLLIFIPIIVSGQDKTLNPRPMTLSEYEKGKSLSIKDLDMDSYIKFENLYILDRYEGKKPYFITGDDGLKKRIDLYRFISKEGMQDLGTKIFYTNESGKTYQALIPNFNSDPTVWTQYFEDIHSIDKIEKDFVLKLSYILSREFSFQQYKIMNGGKDFKDEHATYGTDICFKGNQSLNLADGQKKFIKDIKAGDKLIVINETTNSPEIVAVKKLITHSPKNYAITTLNLVKCLEIPNEDLNEVIISMKVLEATPNHPMKTDSGYKKMRDINLGDKILCLDDKSHQYIYYSVFRKTETGQGNQNVYNIETQKGTTLLLNGIMVMQK